MSDKSKLILKRNFLKGFAGVFGSLGSFAILKPKPLSAREIVKAWEDPEYRNSLTDSQWSQLPENPAGKIENSQLAGDLNSSGNNCSGNNCSGNNCSGNNCSGNTCGLLG